MPVQVEKDEVRGSAGARGCVTPSIRVTMLDLLSIVPYYTGHLCASLANAGGVRVTLASITYQHDPECFRRHGIPNDPGGLNLAYRIRSARPRRIAKILEYAVNLLALSIRFIVKRPDVLHVQFLPLSSYGLPFERWFIRMARALGIKVVYTVHNVLPQDGGASREDIYRRLYELADGLICHDPGAAARLSGEFGVEPGRISVIPHGPLFEGNGRALSGQARSRLAIDPSECLVLAQGILRPYKGIPFLLKAWRRVCDEEPGAQLAVVGTGEREIVREIKDQVRSLAIQSRVRLELRFVSVQELADFYDAADILVYPYREITTSGALLTGIVRGKAVIASRLPAFEGLLRDGESGLLVPYGDVEAFAASLLRLIRNPSLRNALGARLMEHQAGLPRWTEIADQTCDFYRSTAAGRFRRALESNP
jgi:glycosyltransferase involved in cell wall biosynthesis